MLTVPQGSVATSAGPQYGTLEGTIKDGVLQPSADMKGTPHALHFPVWCPRKAADDE